MRLSRVIARATVIAVAIEGFATAFTVQNPASSKAVIPTLSPIHHSFSSSIYRQRRSNELRTRIYVQVEESQKIDASVEVGNDELIDVEINSDPTLNVKTTATLIAGQSVMIGVAALASQILVSCHKHRINRIRLSFCHGDLIVSLNMRCYDHVCSAIESQDQSSRAINRNRLA